MQFTQKRLLHSILIIYALIVALICIGLVPQSLILFHISALILGFVCVIALYNTGSVEVKESPLDNKRHIYFIMIAFALILIFHFFPYTKNTIPLGYGSGLYKYAIEHSLEEKGAWVLQQGNFEPGFIYLMSFFNNFLSSNFILTSLFVIFCLIIGVLVYLCTEQYSSPRTARIALFLFAVSTIQLRAFLLLNYMLTLGIIFLLLAIIFIKKIEQHNKVIWKVLFVLSAFLISIMHKPTFVIFLLSYLIYSLVRPISAKKYNKKILLKNISLFFIILVLAALPNLTSLVTTYSNILSQPEQGFLQLGEKTYQDILFSDYLLSSLIYVPFSILGLFLFIRKREFNLLFILPIVLSIIVYLHLSSFGGFMVLLDLFMMILASFGFMHLIKERKSVGLTIIIILLISAAFMSFNIVKKEFPLIASNELVAIDYLHNTESGASILTSSFYAPWLLGYSDRKVIAPGLYGENKHIEDEWQTFWDAKSSLELQHFMDEYPKPIYIFVGYQQKDNFKNIPECFKVFYQDTDNVIYKYSC